VIALSDIRAGFEPFRAGGSQKRVSTPPKIARTVEGFRNTIR